MKNRKAALVFGIILVALSGAAAARDNVRFSVSIGAPVYEYQPPAPVYYYPPPPPRVVYYAPGPVYYAPPAPVYYAPRWHGHGHGHHNHHRGHRH